MKSRRQELKLPLARKRCVGFTTMETLGREKLVIVNRHNDVENNSKTLIFANTRSSTQSSRMVRSIRCLHGLKAESRGRWIGIRRNG